MAEILIVGKGGFGDVLPLLAIGRELRRRGHQVAVAGEAHHAQACALADLPLHPLALAPQAAARRGVAWTASGRALRDTLSPASLRAEVDALLPLAARADLLLGNQLAYAGSLVRRALRKPWVFCAASPLAIPSRHDAPLWPYLHGLQQLAGRVGLPQRWFIAPARGATRGLMLAHALPRRALGLGSPGHPRFEAMYSERLNLLATSQWLAPPQPDWPRATRVTGFAWFAPQFLGDARQAQALAEFAQQGSPPVVFAPGGSLRGHPQEFLARAVAVCRHLGRRGIVVAAPRFHDALPTGADIAVTSYLPYEQLFPLAAAVVHSGGIGSIGWAMRAAVPQLLVPAEWDQFDNARRAQRAGVAHTLTARQADARAMAHALGEVLDDAALHRRAAQAACAMQTEDGAMAACSAIEALLAGT